MTHIRFSTFVLFLCVTINTADSWTHKQRDFWNAFFGIIKGEQWIMDEDCLSGKFDEYELALKKAIENVDLEGIIKNVDLVLTLELTKCPIAEYKEIIKNIIPRKQIQRTLPPRISHAMNVEEKDINQPNDQRYPQ